MSVDDRNAAVEERVLVLAPTAKDARLCLAILADAGIAGFVCADMRSVCEELALGAGAALLTEESLGFSELARLVTALGRQPAWSDIPILVLTAEGADSPIVLQSLETLGNVTLLERPVRVPTLVSAARTALRARRRQYQIREHLAEGRRVAEVLQHEARRKDEFLAMLAHELRNPLTPIRHAAALLGLKDLDAEVAAEARGVIERQIEHLARLVDDLLDVSRLMRGKIDLRGEPVDLATVVSRAMEVCQPLVRAQRQDLTVSLTAEPVWVHGDAVRLTQIVSNLLNNAVKYTEPGGRIRLSAEREADQVLLRVQDSGIGIAPDLLPHVFELFVQADHSIERSQGGLGIGLTLVKTLVEMHGGRVTAHSDGLGMGSEFTVRLPVLRGGASLRPGEFRPHSIRPLRVLVVEDNQASARILAHMLEKFWNHSVAIAYDGAVALELAESFQPELVLCDIGLPKLNGYEVARRIRNGSSAHNRLLVALTGYGTDDDRRKSAAAGFDEHLLKPTSVTALEELFAHPKLAESRLA